MERILIMLSDIRQGIEFMFNAAFFIITAEIKQTSLSNNVSHREKKKKKNIKNWAKQLIPRL